MDKREFRRRLERAGERAREFAGVLVIEELPPNLLYILNPLDDPHGRRGPEGTLKYLGGRFLKPDELNLLSSARAADLLWVDGRVPAWVNVSVTWADATATHIRLQASGRLATAEEESLAPDVPWAVDPDDPIEPFRIRGPIVPRGWRSVELDGPFRLLETREPS